MIIVALYAFCNREFWMARAWGSRPYHSSRLEAKARAEVAPDYKPQGQTLNVSKPSQTALPAVNQLFKYGNLGLTFQIQNIVSQKTALDHTSATVALLSSSHINSWFKLLVLSTGIVVKQHLSHL